MNEGGVPYACPKCSSSRIYDTIMNEVACQNCGHVDLAREFLSEREWKINKILKPKL